MSTNKPKKSPTLLVLPCLGQSITDNGDDYETEEFKITTKTTVKEMKARLASYGQAIDGTRDELIARLAKFAGDMPEWKQLFRPKQKRKRGDATGTRAQCHSAKRRAAMFTGDEPEQAAYPSKNPGGDRPGAVELTEFQTAQLDETSTETGCTTLQPDAGYAIAEVGQAGSEAGADHGEEDGSPMEVNAAPVAQPSNTLTATPWPLSTAVGQATGSAAVTAPMCPTLTSNTPGTQTSSPSVHHATASYSSASSSTIPAENR
ncbi:hypothetical protein C8T65DRAFT_703908, partial [Cerioporus squamosus]